MILMLTCIPNDFITKKFIHRTLHKLKKHIGAFDKFSRISADQK